MSILNRLIPKFWDHEDVASVPYKHLFNFRQIWKRTVLVTAGVAFIPLITMTFISYNLSQDAIESEIMQRTTRIVSDSWQAVASFMTERKSVLNFIARDRTLEELRDKHRLSAILANLKKEFGGFIDIGLIDTAGIQIAYVGPHALEGKNYSEKTWYRQAVQNNDYISDVVSGFPDVPHLDIAVKHKLPDGSFYVLRAALETKQLSALVAQFETGAAGDAVIINRQGLLQTPSRYYGDLLKQISLPVPEYSTTPKVIEGRNSTGRPLIIGYANIPQTPFILMIIKEKDELMKPWLKTRMYLIVFVLGSIAVILVVILGVATYLVTKIHDADQERVMTLHQVEYTNKMASLGRLAAGVAHEINNPLAIINEKAGHIKDIFTLTDTYARDPKLIDLVDSVHATVERCATVIRRLLNFTHHINSSVEEIHLAEVISEVRAVLVRDAEYRCIEVFVKVPDDIPVFESDRGKLEQVFFNLFNNAFESMRDGGRLEIQAKQEDADSVAVTFTDSSQGIAESEYRRIFEPFFSSKTGESGTGLGLSITYGLVQEIGGTIFVRSQLGKGTVFTIRLPLKMVVPNDRNTCDFSGS